MTITPVHFCFNDGGREAAGFKGRTDDCVTRAIAIATGLSYREVYDRVNSYGKVERMSKRQKRRSSARTGVQKRTTRNILADLGWEWHPTMGIGTGCQVHLRADELPGGTLIANLSSHVVAVIDGVVHDTVDPTRDGTRCVYGYWTPATAPPLCAHANTDGDESRWPASSVLTRAREEILTFERKNR